MKQPVGWRHLAKVGLASVATVLALFFLIHQIRVALPPRDKTPVDPQTLVDPPKGPPMRIAPADLALAGRERSDNGLEMAFCWCPPGSFHMGRLNLDKYKLKRVGVRVTLRHGFWMGKFEVTQAQWQRVMGVTLHEQFAKDPKHPQRFRQHQASLRNEEFLQDQRTGLRRPDEAPKRSPTEVDRTMRDHVGEGPDYPIYSISHAEAEEFCQKLTKAEREAGRLEAGWGYQLPTEAQWEFACRAGTTTATAFGDQLSSTQANFDGKQPLNGAAAGPYLHQTTPVGSYAPNAWGLHDMHGNLWEWCRDGFTETPKGGTDPLEAATPKGWTMRGGCWHNSGFSCVSTDRGPGMVKGGGYGLGFRVALVRVAPEPNHPS